MCVGNNKFQRYLSGVAIAILIKLSVMGTNKKDTSNDNQARLPETSGIALIKPINSVKPMNREILPKSETGKILTDCSPRTTKRYRLIDKEIYP